MSTQKTRWTIEELDYLEKYYKVKSDDEIAKELNKKVNDVKFTRYDYGYKKQGQTFNENKPIDQKWCWFCKKFHEKTEFSKNKNKPDGLQDECKRAVKMIRLKRNNKEKNKKIIIKSKVCSECGKEKKSDEFIKNVSTYDGLSNKCKECLNKENKRFKVEGK